jgi:signal transduction histidine kinase
MQIRQRLTTQFIVVVALILFFSALAIYFFSADYRREDFYTRLQNRAAVTARLLVSVEEVDASLLRKIEEDNPASLPNEKIVIYDRDGAVLNSSDDEGVLQVPEVLRVRIQDEGEVRFKQGQYEALGVLFADKGERVVAVAAAVDIYGLKKLANLRTVLLVVFGASIVLVLISGWLYAGKALEPISRVIEQVDDIGITSLDMRVAGGSGEDEIAKLASTFNKMLERLETAFNVQKNFIANASHELRTPLTAITGQLEVTLMNERTGPEYRRAIASALEDMRNLNTISNRLLLLAQTSTEASAADFKPLRIDDVVWQVRSELLRRNREYRITVNLDPDLQDEEQMTVMGNEQLMKTAVANVADNACKYAPDRHVHIDIRPRGRNIGLRFTDHGIGIDSEDLAHVFEPFHRGRNTLAVRGHGIGLSLADRIVRLHRGTIGVVSELGKGTTFEILLPLRPN